MLKIFKKYIVLFTLVTGVCNTYSYAATITVTNLNDTGTGSLREAITRANSDTVVDKIIFTTGLTGTITLASNLPTITNSLIITGLGVDKLTISGAGLYTMFNVISGKVLTISKFNFTNNSTFNGSVFRADNSGSSIVASDINVTSATNQFAFFTNSVSTITVSNSTFTSNSGILFGSTYGSTPSNTSDNVTEYENRITVLNSIFSNNTGMIFKTQRYVKIDGCTFTNNTGGIGDFRGLNRYQVLNSTFTGNGSTLFTFASTLSSGTYLSTLGTNHHLFNGNTFSNNPDTVINTGTVNEQSKTTISNNIFSNNGTNWTGSPAGESSNTITANNTVTAASSTPTLCMNTALTNITHTTTGATGIGTATGLPTGVTAAFASNTITISGTPTVGGTFNYSIPLTGGFGSVNATGTITVNASLTVNVTVNGDACVNKTTLTATAGLPTYAWYKDNVIITGEISNTYKPIAAGDYKVQVSNGTCSTTSIATTISVCGVTADGKMTSIANVNAIVSNEGGVNFGTGLNDLGSILNTTGLTTTKGAIGVTTAVLGGVISATNAITSSIGVIYSTDANFGAYSTTTIQSNVAAGAYTSTISGLASLTTYYAKSFIINKAGTIYGSVVNFTTSSSPVLEGDVYGGGIVYYILKSGDNGYDANVQHGLIAPFNSISRQSTSPLPPLVESQIGLNAATISAAQFDGLLVGKTNTDAIILNQGSSGTYAALYCRNYVNPTSKTFNAVSYTFPAYNDWYMPSIVEINKFRAYVWNTHPSKGTYFNYGNNLIYYKGASGNDYAWGKYLSSTMTGSRYKLYYLESGNEDGSTAYNGWDEFDRLVVMPIRSF